MPRLLRLALEPQTAARNLAILLPPVPTTAPKPPPASQVGPRREAAAGAAREHHQTTRYTCLTTARVLFWSDIRARVLYGRETKTARGSVRAVRFIDFKSKSFFFFVQFV